MADMFSSIRRVRQLTKKEPSTGDVFKRLCVRLNEDPSRYRAKDSQGNSIPFEIYQSDEERAIAILDPNGKAHRLRSACGLARAWLLRPQGDRPTRGQVRWLLRVRCLCHARCSCGHGPCDGRLRESCWRRLELMRPRDLVAHLAGDAQGTHALGDAIEDRG